MQGDIFGENFDVENPDEVRMGLCLCRNLDALRHFESYI